MNTIQQLTREERFYIAGFLDGDGCINAQIIQRKDYVLKYQIRVSITFFQKTKRLNFLQWLQKKIGCGTIRSKTDGVSEYTIVGLTDVCDVLKTLEPILRLKREQAKLVLKICNNLPLVENNPHKFYNLCELVDTFGLLNDSKKRKITALVVQQNLNILKVPVETETPFST